MMSYEDLKNSALILMPNTDSLLATQLLQFFFWPESEILLTTKLLYALSI